MKISRKIFLAVFVPSFIVAVIGSMVATSFAVSALVTESKERLLGVTASRSFHVETYFHELTGRTADRANDSTIIDCLSQNDAEVQAKCNESDLNAYLAEKKEEGVEGLLEIYVLDGQGQVVASTDEQQFEESRDYSESWQYTKGIEGAYLHDLKFDPESNTGAFIVAAPIRQGNRAVGVKVEKYSAEKLYEILGSKIGLGESVEVFLVSEKRELISPFLHDGYYQLFQEVKTDHAFKHCDQDDIGDNMAMSVGAIDIQEVVRAHSFTDKAVFSSHAHFNEHGWCLVSQVEVDEVLAPVWQLIILFLIVGTIGAFLLLISAFSLSYVISRPVQVFSKSVAQIEKGDFNIFVDWRSSDEFGKLASAINTMAIKIKTTVADLEEKVEERTRELAGKITLIEEQNNQLELAKTAMNNLLEDVSFEKDEESTKSRSVVENIGEGIIITNDHGLITYVNPAFEKMMGLKLEELADQPFQEKVKLFDLQKNAIDPDKINDAFVKENQKSELKALLECSPGNKIAIVINAAQIVVNGEYTGIVRVVHDFSDDLKLQQQKDDFFSIASHELRTPLTVISGNLDMLSDLAKAGPLDKDGLELLQDAEKSSDRLIQMVEDFLNVSRIDQGRLKADIEKVQLCELAQEVVTELQPLADKKSIALKITCPTEPVFVDADPKLVKQIIINLIGNSLKFTKKGEISVQFKLSDKLVQLDVVDTGAGIDPSKQGILFNRFQQAMDRTLSREAGGTGLGLYISKQFAQLMGGDLVLTKSVPGEGSTFSLTLKLSEDQTQPTKTVQQA